MSKAKEALDELRRKLAEERRRDEEYAARVAALEREAEEEDRREPPLYVVNEPAGGRDGLVPESTDSPLGVPVIFTDMADGILALDFGLTFAGFSYEARQLVLSIVGLLGDGETTLEISDPELAEHLNCSERTIGRWRRAYSDEAYAKSYSPLEITEGEYDADTERYRPTKYRFTGANFVEQTVTEARNSDEYTRNRQAAIERSAAARYDDIPNAPVRRRQRKPRIVPTLRLERHFINAERNIVRGRITLEDLPERSRAAFLNSQQGKELYARLLKLQEEIAGILEDFPQISDDKDLEDKVDILSGIPPDDETAAGATIESSVSAPDEATAGETGVRVNKEDPRTQELEIWERIEGRFKPPGDAPPEKSPAQSSPPAELENDAAQAVADDDIQAGMDEYELELERAFNLYLESGMPAREARLAAVREVGDLQLWLKGRRTTELLE